MKLIINISDDVYTRLFDNGKPMDIADGIVMERAIRNGTPIPDNATNGEIADMMFPDANIGYRYWFPDSTLRFMDTNWWDAKYQKGNK